MGNADFISILFIAIGLSADCFAVSLGVSSKAVLYSWFQILRVSLSFGLFQAIMPLLGWVAGKTVVELIEHFDHWVAFTLLAFVGGRMIWESFRPNNNNEKQIIITKWLVLLTLSVATSIDALAVGLSFAFLKVNIAMASLTIGVVAFLVTTIGFVVGKRASKIIGKRAEAIGGIILLAIALRILLSHIL